MTRIIGIFFIGLLGASNLRAVEFIQNSAAKDGSSIQVRLSEQDLAEEFLVIWADGIPEFRDQEFQIPNLSVSFKDGEQEYFTNPNLRRETLLMAPLRDAGANILTIKVSFEKPSGFKISFPYQEIWAEYRLKNDTGWVFPPALEELEFPVWDTTRTEWDSNLTLFLPEFTTEEDTLVVMFDHSANSNLDSKVFIDWQYRSGFYTLEIDENGRLAIPMNEILHWFQVKTIEIKPAGFGGNSSTGWLWYTATIPQTGQTAIAVHSGYAFRTWYADHKPEDPIAFITGSTTAVEATSWGQVKAQMK